jgi:hypothetical protein
MMDLTNICLTITDGSGPGSCPMTGFGISGVEPPRLSTTV